VNEERLERAIGPFALAANAVNLTVGAGVFALPAAVAALLGPAAVIPYILCGLTITCVLLCCAELGSQTTRSGGVITYTEDAFGPLAGFLAWTVYAIGCCVLSDAAIAHVLMDSVAVSVPALRDGLPRIAAFAMLFGGLAAVNVRGVRHGTAVSVISTVTKIVPLVTLIAFGLPAMHWSELRWPEWPASPALGQASLLVFFIFMSGEGALSAGGEIREPARTVPRAMVGAAATLMLLYTSLQIVSQGVLGPSLAQQGSTPLAAVADRVFGGSGRDLVLACTAVAVFGSIAADMVNTPRAFFAVANDGLLAAPLGAVHARFRTPYVAIITYAAILFVFTISGAFRPLAVLATISQLLMYLAVCLAVLRMRRLREPPFRVPGGPIVPVLGAAAVVWFLSNSTGSEALAVAVTLAIAAIYYVVRTHQSDFSAEARHVMTTNAPVNPNKALWEKGDFTRIADTMREGGDALVERIGVTKGLKVLDLGCGDGTTALPEAKRGADVLGVDIARNLVEAGNRRAREQHLTNVRFQEGDATNLNELADKSFDLVVSFFGVMFAPKPFDVAKEMVRVTKPGGRIVMGNWIPNDPTLVAQILKISSSFTPPPPEGFISPMTWGVESHVTERFGAAGIPAANISFVRDTFVFNYRGTPAALVNEFRRYYGPTMNAFEAAERNGKAAQLQKELEDLFTRQNQGKDGTSIPATFLRVTVVV
jgi:amino acid transporter/SAM-dependent methyltransferase